MSKGQHHNVRVYFVTPKKPGKLAQVLAHHLKADLNDIHKLIGLGAVWHEKRRLQKPDIDIEPGQTLEVYWATTLNERYVLDTARIVTETDDWLIVDKPANLSTVPDRSHVENNLSYGVAQYYRRSNIRYHANPISRLDFQVQGLVLFAKHKYAESKLAKAMIRGHIGKIYTAVLSKPIETSRTWNRIHDTLGFTDRAIVDPDGKDAHSVFIRQPDVNGHPVYSVVIQTGRRHQIRIHAAHYFAPIMGDTWYGASKIKTPGIALISTGYNFWDLVGNRVRVRLPNVDARIRQFCSVPH